MIFSSSAGKLLSPVIAQLSEKYPNVTTYKIDIDQVRRISDSILQKPVQVIALGRGVYSITVMLHHQLLDAKYGEQKNKHD